MDFFDELHGGGASVDEQQGRHQGHSSLPAPDITIGMLFSFPITNLGQIPKPGLDTVVGCCIRLSVVSWGLVM